MTGQTLIATFGATQPQFAVGVSDELNPKQAKEISEPISEPVLFSSDKNSTNLPASLQMKLSLIKESWVKNTQHLEKFINQTKSDLASHRLPSQKLALNDEWQVPFRAALDEMQEMSKAASDEPTLIKKDWEQDVNRVSDLIVEYRDPYETAVPKFTEFWNEFANLISNLSAYYTVDTDKNGIQTLKFNESFIKDLDVLIGKYEKGPEGILYPVSGTVSKEKAELWATRMGMDASCVKAENGGYVVRVDLRPLEAIRASVTTEAMAMVQFNSWDIGFNLQKDKYQTAAQVLTNKYANAIQFFNNEFQRISTSILAFFEHIKKLNSSN